jgi:hypothetical protein
MELIGKVKVVNPEQQISEKFVKRELVITTEETYPQHILIEFIQDKVDLIDKLNPGDEVKVHINISGRLWTNPQGEDKYFNSIKGWRVEKLSADAPEPHQVKHPTNQAPATQSKPQEFEPANNFKEEEHDDLPF